jgi:flagellin
MALKVDKNTGSIMYKDDAYSVNKSMETSMERLSTGKRINSAADDAAGVAIASRLTSEIRGTNQAIRNAMDGQALLDTAEGAHVEVTDILQRMREIAIQAANDTSNADDRNQLEVEMTNLSAEIDRIAQTTTWAGKQLLNGALTGNTGSGSGDASYDFHIGSRTNSADTITTTISSMRASVLGVNGDQTVTGVGDTSQSGLVSVANSDSTSMTLNMGSLVETATTSITIDGISFTTAAGASSANDNATSMAALITANANFTATVVGGSGVKVTKTSADFSSAFQNRTNALAQVTLIDTALTTILTQRAKLGSVSNRLDHTVDNLTNTVTNLSAGKGRIEDADFAAETTNLARTQILQQASTAMLAQANASKQNVLSLLQG